jgi:hypothetical protein
VALSLFTAFTPVAERSEATPGSINARLQQLQDNTLSLYSNVSTVLQNPLSTNTLRPESGNTISAVTSTAFVSKSIDSGGAYWNLAAFSPAGDGSTNDRAALALADAKGDCFLSAGTYLVSSDITLTSRWRFANRALIKPASGVTVYFGGQGYDAGPRQHIFDVSAGGNIAFQQFTDVEVTPCHFGADSSYTADSTAAFQKCFNSQAIRYFIPWGQYDVRSTVTIPAVRVLVRGDALPSSIYFNPSTHSISLFEGVAAGGDNWEFSRFQIHNNNNGSKIGITGFNFADGDIGALHFDRVYVSSFNSFGLKLTGAEYFKAERCRFMDMNSAAGATPACALGSTSYINSGYIKGCRFAQNDKDIKTTGFYALGIDNCSFELDGATSTATPTAIVELTNNGTDAAGGLTFLNNYVEAPRPGEGYGFLHMTNVAGALIRGNFLSGEFGGTVQTRRMIYSTGTLANGITVSNNRFYSVKTYFIDIASQVARAWDNAYFDTGTGELTSYNSVMVKMNGKVEVNNFRVSSFLDVPSLSSYSGYESSDVSVAGLVIGDHVEVTSDDISQAGVTVSGYVRATGQARMLFWNGSADTVDLGASDWLLRIRKAEMRV